MSLPDDATGSTRRRIILINSFLNSGGSQQATIRLARQLKMRGYDAEAWFLYRKGGFYASEIEGVQASVLVDKPALSALDYLRVASRLWRSFQHRRPDAVVTFLPLAATLAQAAALASGVRARITSQRVPGSTYKSLLRVLDQLWGTLGVFKEIVCVSDAVRDSFLAYPQSYRRRLSVVHNGIEWTPPRIGRAEARSRFGLADGEFVLLSIGRLQAQKNFGLAIRAIQGLEGVRLVIAGDGPDRKSLEHLARELGVSDRVRLLGNQTPEAVGELLALSDVFLQPSLFEGQSNALLEAMHAGLPILASDIPEQRETLQISEGVHAGLLLALDDPDAWRETIARLRKDVVLQAALGRQARALVNERFDLATMVSKFERLILAHV